MGLFFCMPAAVSAKSESEIRSLTLVQLNMLRANGIQDPLCTQMAGENATNMNDYSSGSHQVRTKLQPPQHEQQPQAIDGEFVVGPQHKPWNLLVVFLFKQGLCCSNFMSHILVEIFNS